MIKNAKRFFGRWGVYMLLFIISPGILGAQALIPFAEYANNPVYGQHTGNGRAYYPSVISSGGYYYMWFADGSGKIWRGTSTDGITWTGVTQITFNPALPGGISPNHPAVVYHSAIGYKMYFWDGSTSGLSTMVAESTNGFNWTNPRHITQDPGQPLQGGSYGTYWYHHYGPGQVIYNPTAVNSGANPWNYSYVMTFDTAGEGYSAGVGVEHCGLAYSDDGDYWFRFGNTPLLTSSNDGNWDSRYIYHGTITRNGNYWYLWYSGADGTGTNYYAQGIGAAFSNDGLNWTKFSVPTLHFSDGKAWRNERTYAQCVLYENGQYKMWFSGKDSSQYSLGYAASDTPSITVTSPQNGYIWYSGFSYPITWTWTGSLGDVRILLSTDNGATYTAIANLTANDGSYDWLIPANIGSPACRIKIRMLNGTIFGISDVFIIGGNKWLPCQEPCSGIYYGTAYGYSRHIAVGGQGKMAQSNNGIDWSQSTSPTANTLNDVYFNGLHFVTVGENSSLFVCNSNWQWFRYQLNIIPPGTGINGVTFGNNQWIAVGDSGLIIKGNADASSWSVVGLPQQCPDLLDVTYGNNKFVAVGKNGALLTGTDGNAWTSCTLPPSIVNITDVTYSGTLQLFALVGEGGAIATSSDGRTWTKRISGTTGDLQGVLWQCNKFVAPGLSGIILESNNGIDWTAVNSGVANDLYVAGFGGNTWTALGNNAFLFNLSCN
ncbi:MAG TPA: hypothetical protein VK186_12205 [Candidatus Deferrimicrobium sp.]|nr:hypothetical protein [Candidatus Deferrimicrobium sp.]